MKIIYLFEIYKNFSDEDIKNFEKFLRSPFFNNKKSLLKLFKEIIKNRDLMFLNESNTLVNKICVNQKWSNNKTSKEFTSLSKATIEYLKVSTLLNNNNLSELLVNEYLLKKKTFPLLENRINKFSNYLNNENKLDDDVIFNSFKSNIINFDMQLQNENYLKRKSNGDEFGILREATKDISLYSLIQLTCIYVNYYFLEINYGLKKDNLFPIDLNDKFRNCLKNSLFKNDEYKKMLFNIYFSLYNAISSRGDKKKYILYKKNVLSSVNLFSKKSLKYHYQVLINFCMTKDRLGEDKGFFKNEYTGLLYDYFNNDYFKVDNEYINPIEYSNFVYISYITNNFQKLKLFIENNSAKLNPSVCNNMVNYGLAYYYFGLKEYKKVLKHINNITINKFTFKYDVRNLEIRIYYELNKLETLRTAIHNYRTSILGDEALTKYDKESLIKMLSYVNKLISLNEEMDTFQRKSDAKFIYKLIEKEPIFSLKKWLMEKYLLIQNLK